MFQVPVPHDVLDVLENAYRFDGDDAEWLDRVARSIQRQIDPRRYGIFSFLYTLTSDGRVSTSTARAYDVPEPFASSTGQIVAALPPWYVRQTFAQHPCASGIHTGDAKCRAFSRNLIKEGFSPLGIKDLFVINGLDPTGSGVYVAAARKTSADLARPVRARWTRVGVHLASAWRLRRALRVPAAASVDAAEAVLRPDGKIEHAREEARAQDARKSLTHAARAIERARTRKSSSSDDRDVSEWTGLIAARWSLVDHFESDGKRWLLARRNDVADVGQAELSPRELQAVAFAALGHTNKLIAYEMGIAAETVRVLLHRAARKLGANDRSELITRARLTFTPTV
jgi:DNA-binding CsgD family transcriptional regulator